MSIYYIKHSSTRAKRFQLTTTVYEQDGIKYVKKEASSNEAIAHLQSIKRGYELLQKSIINPKLKLAKIVDESDSSLVFEFIEGESLERRYFLARERSEKEAFGVIDEYRELISYSFETTTKSDNSHIDIFGDYTTDDSIYLDGVTNIDLIFSNIIYSGDEIYIIDYEWVFEMSLSLDYIYFRAILSLGDSTLLKRYFGDKELESFRAMEDNFLLGYVFDKGSFFQLQHYYLKDRVDPTVVIGEQDTLISQQKELISQQSKTVENKEDIISKQHEHISELTNQIKELQSIAQSLRIKNRLKRLAPQKLLSPIRAIRQNPALLKKALYYIKRGEISYLWKRAQQKSQNSIIRQEGSSIIEPKDYFKPFDMKRYKIEDRVIDIIIPVYNGYEFLTPLFDSIERNTTAPYRLIVVNDSSPDERVKPLLLERLANHPTAIFVDHEVNLGFVKSVNEAYTYTSDHFLILNTDTEVPKYWVERLMYPILNMEKIATTTPFTNSGQIASFPNFIADNNIFEGMSVDSLDEVFREFNPDKFYSIVPTGVGFCMGINYELIEEIGFFVEEEFGRGYGEENDWCQRAIIEGYDNLIVPNLFVYHKHGGSFSAEDKKRLMQENAIKLLHKHPNYDKDIQSYVSQDPHKVLREIAVVVASSKEGEALHLIIDQALGGGANEYTKAKVEEYKRDEKKILRVIYDHYSSNYLVYFDYGEYSYSFVLSNFKDIQELLSHLKFREIFINNLVSFREIPELLLWIEELVEQNSASLVVPIHDYFSICPNYTLLEPNGRFCEIPNSIVSCQECMSSNDLEWRTLIDREIDMRKWRDEWGRLLVLSDKIICFSDSSKELLLRAYTTLDTKKIEIIPHTVEPLPKVDIASKPKGSPLVVGVLGAINQAKGANIIEELVASIDRDNLNIRVTLIGEISKNISSDSFKMTGRYKRDKLPSLIAKEQIDIFLIPSVCPETFSYTTSEIIMMDMPLIVFDVGAPPERVKEYKKGVVISKEYLPNTLQHLLSLQ
jgi:GT2 family glycosyltransferase/glycosyltransferase involved in cell wall biosynthesis